MHARQKILSTLGEIDQWLKQLALSTKTAETILQEFSEHDFRLERAVSEYTGSSKAWHASERHFREIWEKPKKSEAGPAFFALENAHGVAAESLLRYFNAREFFFALVERGERRKEKVKDLSESIDIIIERSREEFSEAAEKLSENL